MRKCVPLVLAAVVCGLTSNAQAFFSLFVSFVPLSAPLDDAGWCGYLITVIPDNRSMVRGIDAANTVPGRGLPGGIYGPVLQRWTLDTSALDGSIQRMPTALVALTAPAGIPGRTDSCWLNRDYFEAIEIAPREDNNGLNATTGLQDRPAVADVENGIFIDGADFGIGTSMTFVGYAVHPTSDPLNVAFVIAQSDVSEVIFRASILDENGHWTALEMSLAEPEPASISLLAAGSLALLARRRERRTTGDRM